MFDRSRNIVENKLGGHPPFHNKPQWYQSEQVLLSAAPRANSATRFLLRQAGALQVSHFTIFTGKV